MQINYDQIFAEAFESIKDISVTKIIPFQNKTQIVYKVEGIIIYHGKEQAVVIQISEQEYLRILAIGLNKINNSNIEYARK